MRRTVVLAAAVLLTGCNTGPSTSFRPTPPPPPEVTRSVTGSVRDTVDRVVPGARVEVTTGRLAGTFVTTDEAGGFTFVEPVPLFSQIKASKHGYLDAVTALGSGTPIPLVFKLGSPNHPIDLPGVYDITFEADATCTALPDVARKRTYQAPVRSITELSGATFLGGDPPFNVISLRQFDEYIKFSMYDPPIWEFIPAASYILISGEALGVANPDFSQLLMEGEFKYCPSVSPGNVAACAVETVTCRASGHVMTLKRR